jgi:D-3-phosphoglycerate dehydrogenase / 2-oxoglutarate reductase
VIANKKCLVIDPMHESLFSMLAEIGWKADYQPEISREEIRQHHTGYDSREEIRQRHIGYDGIIVRSKTAIDHDLLGEHPTVKFVGRAGAGMDNLDIDYLNQKQIYVLHAAEGNRDAVGEFTVGLLLTLLRNIAIADPRK